jgi:hypothetical protein
MSTIALTPGDLEATASTLQRAGSELSSVGGRTPGGGPGDLGSPELEQAVAELSKSSFQVVVALYYAVAQTGRNLALSSYAYMTVDGRSMRTGGP